MGSLVQCPFHRKAKVKPDIKILYQVQSLDGRGIFHPMHSQEGSENAVKQKISVAMEKKLFELLHGEKFCFIFS